MEKKIVKSNNLRKPDVSADVIYKKLDKIIEDRKKYKKLSTISIDLEHIYDSTQRITNNITAFSNALGLNNEKAADELVEL